MTDKVASLFKDLGFSSKDKDTGDAKYFQRGKIQELRAELTADSRNDPKFVKKKVAMKKVVANMTMGNDMSPLFPDVMNCLQLPVLEIKKMVYLYLVHYAKAKPDLAVQALPYLAHDALDANPLLRAMAVRTMSYINVDRFTEAFAPILRTCILDSDPYVRKTAAMSVPKVYMHDPNMIESEGFMDLLYNLLNDSNAMVVSNAVAALSEISDRSEIFDFQIDISMANKLMTALNECTEWGQVYILEGLMFYAPETCDDAEQLAERVLPRLQHANSAVVLASVKVIIHLMNYIQREDVLSNLYRKLAPPLVTLLHNGYEVQYVALRNILLVIQKRPDLLSGDIKVFFCKYNDPIYVKLAKLEIMIRLTDEGNVDSVISELKEYSSEVDVEFLKKSVRALGRCAIKVPQAADKCVKTLVDLIQTKVDYVVQEAVVVIKDIFRRYPNRYESIISTLCDNLDSLDAPEAKASMIWIIGQYADRIENAQELLDGFLSTFKEEPTEVQLALLTATMKLFLKRPTAGQELVPKLLKWATEETDNPDLRDRAFIYWRLLSTDPVSAKLIVLGDKPLISTETDNLDPAFLDDICLYLDTLGAVYHKLPTSFIGNIKPRKLIQTPALNLNNLHRNANGFGDDDELEARPDYMNPYSNDVRPLQVAPHDYDDLADAGEEAPFEDAGQFARLGEPITPVTAFKKMDFDQVKPKPQESGHVTGGMAGMGSTGIVPGGFNDVNSGIASNYPPPSTIPPPMQDLQSPLQPSGYVAPKVTMLQSQNGKGLEISGTFARRQGIVFMEMILSNRSNSSLQDFAIRFNKNSFGLVAGPFNVPPILSGTNVPMAVRINVDPSQVNTMNPINLLQVAIKNNSGVSYFAAQVPLHVLFVERPLDQGDWLRLWREEIPDNVETRTNISSLSYPSVEAIRNKLNLNNVFTVADRLINGMHHIYSSASLPDGTVFLTELTLDQNLSQGTLAVKTLAQPLSSLFQLAISDILHSNQ